MKRPLFSILLLICLSILIALAGCSSNEEKNLPQNQKKHKKVLRNIPWEMTIP